jgi:hypothetical protein
MESVCRLSNQTRKPSTCPGFLAGRRTIPAEKAPVWMGAYTATCILDNKKRKVDISVYAGFFYDELEKKYYQIPSDIQQDWLNYLSDFAASLQSVYY